MSNSSVDNTDTDEPRIDVEWTPPLVSQLNLTATADRCNNATLWLAQYFKTIQDDTMQDDVPFGTTLDYLRLLVPDNHSAPTDAQLATWYIRIAYGLEIDSADNPGDNATDTFIAVLQFAVSDCDDAICNKLGWKGDPDVSGIGMLVTYFLIAIMSTVYCVVVAWANFKLRRNRQWRIPRVVSAFSESVAPFIIIAVTFAASMLAAGITRFAYYKHHPEDHDSLYGLIVSVFQSTFSILPGLALQSIVDGPRRQWIGLFLWFVVIALLITLQFLYRTIYKAQGWGATRNQVDTPHWGGVRRERSQALETLWLFYCDPNDLRYPLEDTLLATHIMMCFAAIWWIYYVVVSLVPARLYARIHSRTTNATRRRWRQCRRFLRCINCLACIVLMWVLLIMFYRYRSKVQTIAGHSNEDYKWTFGQMLALCAFAPVIVELFSIMICGPEWGLEGVMSERFEVIKRDPPPVNDEKDKVSESNDARDAESQEKEPGGDEKLAIAEAHEQ